MTERRVDPSSTVGTSDETGEEGGLTLRHDVSLFFSSPRSKFSDESGSCPSPVLLLEVGSVGEGGTGLETHEYISIKSMTLTSGLSIGLNLRLWYTCSLPPTPRPLSRMVGSFRLYHLSLSP